MDTTNKRYANFDAFKEELQRWKSEHQTEYAEFARQMNEGDENQFIRFFFAVQQQLPGLLKTWQTSYNDDTIDNLSQMSLYFSEKSVPQHIIGLYHQQKENIQTKETKDKSSFSQWVKRLFFKETKSQVTLSAPLVLCWLVFGRSFETMVDMLSMHANNPKASKIDKLTCSTTIKQIIKASIKSGYRTPQVWKEYLQQSDALHNGNITEWALSTICDGEDAQRQQLQTTPQPEEIKLSGRRAAQEKNLIEFLNCDNAEGVIEVIRNFVITHNTSYGLALPYYALTDLHLLTEMHSAKEYSIALTREFSDISGLKSESSCRQAIKWLRDIRQVERDGRMQMLPLIESDENQHLLQMLKSQISEAIAQEAPMSQQ